MLSDEVGLVVDPAARTFSVTALRVPAPAVGGRRCRKQVCQCRGRARFFTDEQLAANLGRLLDHHRRLPFVSELNRLPLIAAYWRYRNRFGSRQ